MKKFMLLITSVVLLAGCGTTYTATQVGPDRYVHTANGKNVDGNSYTAILEQAYSKCASEQFQDYSVTRIAYERDSMIVHVQCEKEKKTGPAADARDSPNAAIEDMKRLYETAKKKVEEKLGE